MNNKLTKIVSGGLVLSTINTSVVQACDSAVMMEVATEASVICPYAAPIIVTGALVITGVTTVIGIKQKNKEIPAIYYTLGHLPDHWRPGSIMDKINPGGRVIQRRIYDSEGRPLKDIDLSHHGTPKYHPWTYEGKHIHVHDHVYGKNITKNRRPARSISKEEYDKYVKEIDKIDINKRYRMRVEPKNNNNYVNHK